VSPNKTIVVDPQEDTASDLLVIDDSNSPSPPPVPNSIEIAMEIDSRPSSTQNVGPHHGHPGQQHERQHAYSPISHMDVNKNSLPPPSSIQSSTTLAPLRSTSSEAPSNPPPSVASAARSHEGLYNAHPPPRESSIGSTQRKDYSRIIAHVPSSSEHHTNGASCPRSPAEVSLDAIERLQTQISQNSGALAAHTRDIRRGEESFQALEATLRREFAAQVHNQAADIQRVDDAVARLHLEMQGMRQALETVSHELAINRAEVQRGAAAAPGQSARGSNSALELMAQQVAVMSHKTSELDNLRVTVEIMKEKIHYLEQGAKAAQATSALKATPPLFQSSHGPLPTQNNKSASFHSTPAVHPRARSPTQTPSNPQAHQSFGPPSTSTLPDSGERPESTPSHGAAWASINAGTKRMHMAGVESPLESAEHVPGSPKRQKVAAADPEASYATSLSLPYQQAHEHGNADISATRLQAPPSTLPTQLPVPEHSIPSQTQHSVYAPYATQDGPSDDSWRPESQRIIEHRPRGRGRGGGPGSRGGRVRKSMPALAHQFGTPEWEREDWQDVPDAQAGPEGYYIHVARSGRGISRRGSGGGGRGGYAQSERAASLGSQGVSPGFSIGSPNDPYAHTKKTRTKPIRNADGVLIRKDGRPDMRSQSSAANLRKVHARKEGELSAQGSPAEVTPTNFHHSASIDAPDTPSPSGYAQIDQHAPSSVQRKHSAIMGKMFPSGLDESRRQNDYAHQVFEDDRDHTAHPRSQNHRSEKSSAAKIKKEQFAKHKALQTGDADEEDIDMDHTDGYDQDETPNQQSRTVQDGNAEEPMVPETQAVNTQSSATFTASASTLQ
jgi:hypothetical protein